MLKIIMIMVFAGLILISCIRLFAMGKKIPCLTEGHETVLKGTVHIQKYMYSKHGYDDRRGYAIILKPEKPIRFQSDSGDNIEMKTFTEIQLFPTRKFQHYKEGKKIKVKGVVSASETLQNMKNQEIGPYERFFCDIVLISN